MEGSSSTTSSSKLFTKWKELPKEILLDRILYDYCDGTALSELVTAIIWYGTRTCNGHGERKTPATVAEAVEATAEATTTTTTIAQRQRPTVEKKYITTTDPILSDVLWTIIDIGRRRMIDTITKLQYSSSQNNNYSFDAIYWIQTKMTKMISDVDACMVEDSNIKNMMMMMMMNTNQSSLVDTETTTATTMNSTNTNTKRTFILHQNKVVILLNRFCNFLSLLNYIEGSVRDYSTIVRVQQQRHPLPPPPPTLPSSSSSSTVTVPLECYEWPIWCGVIIVDTIVDATQIRQSAKVVITTPITERLHPISSTVPGWRSLFCHQLFGSSSAKSKSSSSHCKPTEMFKCEPYNTIPTPPWGRIRGITIEDEHVLTNHIGIYLYTTNQIAVPQQINPNLNIRIMTQQQAQTRRLYGTSNGIVTNESIRIQMQQQHGQQQQQQHHQQQLNRWIPKQVPTEWIIQCNTTNNNSQTSSNNNTTSVNNMDENNNSTTTTTTTATTETLPVPVPEGCSLICTWQYEDDIPTVANTFFTNDCGSIEYLLQIQKMIELWTYSTDDGT